ncbi:2-hydroxyacid dehydrogenase [Pseudoduganella aquatica]|nr:2-hydroxyacid dehydrogenase [Pseudoduganella aquatica]
MDLSIKPQVLLLISMAAPFVEEIQSRWPMAALPDAAALERLARNSPEQLAGVRVVITNGSTGLSAAQMDALPALRLVCSYGAGYENINLAAADARGVAVTHAPGVNNATVADHALALMLACARGLPALDRAVKAGHWLAHRMARPAVHGKRLGIVGMGNIGALIARRAAAFDMEIAYTTRGARPELPYRHVPDVLELARASDYLVLACPGGAATRHLVNAAVLEALGSKGFLVNIARGSVVDTAALMQALERRTIAGAALDVIEDEPALPPGAALLDTLILTPHISGRSPEAQLAQHEVLLANLAAHFAGGPLRHALA